MNFSYYKYCIVPHCINTTIKTPNKLFIRVPSSEKIRKKWLKLARRNDVDSLSTISRMYFCEDHFDLPNDMVNYMEYHIMGTVSQVRLKPGCIPSKFECQKEKQRIQTITECLNEPTKNCEPSSSLKDSFVTNFQTVEQPFIIKKQRMMTITECLNEPTGSYYKPSLAVKDTFNKSTDIQTEEQPFIIKKPKLMTITECLNEPPDSGKPSSSIKDTFDKSTDLQTVHMPEILSKQKANKSVQAYVAHKFRSKAIQTKTKTINQALSPIKPSLTSCSTSPFKAGIAIKSCPSVSGLSKITRNILIEEEHSDSDISLYMPSVDSDRSPSVHSLQVKSSSECSEIVAEDRKLEVQETILNTIKKIEKRPRLYIGVPNSCYFLIDIIIDELKIPKHHLLLCLHKIRLDSTFNQLTDDYTMTPSYLSKIFLKNIPLIASVMHPFIVTLDSEMIKRTLPMSFRHKFYNVCCIIDCLEIEVQKPSKAVNQALTWSEYKKANTIKYLISCTPNGLVNYISPGFGGRTTDTCLVESCDFVKTLRSGMCVMADRGFKHVEQYLRKSGITLVRPPSVEAGVKMSKSEARLTKQIASLRIHVERVIRRLREFYMLKPHACINLRFVKILDEILIIACALINLQDSLIK